jgi:hypothetical protein
VLIRIVVRHRLLGLMSEIPPASRGGATAGDQDRADLR